MGISIAATKNPVLKAIYEMSNGECFSDNGVITLVTDACEHNERRSCVILESGELIDIKLNDEFPMVNVMAQIEEVFHGE